MTSRDISDDELVPLILTADDEALAEGHSPRARPMFIITKVMNKLGYESFISMGRGKPQIVDRIERIHRAFYRTNDVAIGSVHGGIFMFRDVFVSIHIPIIFGSVKIIPDELTDLTPMQLRWLKSRREYGIFLDQFVDIFDFAGGIVPVDKFARPPQDALGTLWNAAFQLQASASILSASLDFRGAIQSAMIGTELALKGGLAALGDSEAQRRKHGHDWSSAARAFAERKSDFDIDRVLRVLGRWPNYVENRYSPAQPDRIETGHIVMGAQFVAGEVMRQLTGHSIGRASNTAHQRSYPT